jgi:hypothetical protein
MDSKKKKVKDLFFLKEEEEEERRRGRRMDDCWRCSRKGGMREEGRKDLEKNGRSQRERAKKVDFW